MPRTKVDGTVNRLKIAKFIRDFTKDNHYAPSARDICRGIPELTSLSVVKHHLDTLVEMGVVSMTPKVGRSLYILNPQWIDVEEQRLKELGDAVEQPERLANA